MKRAVWPTSLGAKFDDFVPIPDDGNGMLLSVISSLASVVTGETMTNENKNANVRDQSEQAKAEQVDQQAQQNQGSAAAERGERAPRGRRPLFRS